MGEPDLKPSTVTDRPWIHAYFPGRGRPTATLAGKWLVFVPSAEVDSWWTKIRSAVEAGQLGPQAKVATAYDNSLAVSARLRVICVYTPDWTDKADVRRVLASLRELGVSWRLSYKTNDATARGRYGDGSAIYVSQAGSTTFENRTDDATGANKTCQVCRQSFNPDDPAQWACPRAFRGRHVPTDRPGTIYVLCLGEPAHIREADRACIQPTTHYVGWTGQVPARRIRQHGVPESSIAQLTPGTAEDEQRLKATGSCPRCGKPLAPECLGNVRDR